LRFPRRKTGGAATTRRRKGKAAVEAKATPIARQRNVRHEDASDVKEKERENISEHKYVRKGEIRMKNKEKAMNGREIKVDIQPKLTVDARLFVSNGRRN
jgi:hypothetical protein